MKKIKTPVVSIDLETTGLICGYNEIFEIGMVKLDRNFCLTNDIFHSYVRVIHPDRFSQRAQEVTGITPEELLQYPHIDDVKDELINWIKRISPTSEMIRPLGQFFDGFDRGFLKLYFDKIVTVVDDDGNEKETTEFDKHFLRSSIDLKHSAIDFDNWISYNNVPYKKIREYSLEKIAEYLQVKNPQAHSALNDAKTTAICYKKLLGIRRY